MEPETKPLKKVERRYLIGTQKAGIGMRAKENGMPEVFGYAAIFNSYSEDLGFFYEVFEPGAFAVALGDERTKALGCYNHDTSAVPIAVFRGGGQQRTLELAEDSTGLRASCTPADTGLGRDLVESIKRGDTDGMSILFRAVDDDWRDTHNGVALRRVKQAEIFDVTWTPIPAYPDTTCSIRSNINSNESNVMTLEDYEALFRSKNDSVEQRIKAAAQVRERRLHLIKLTGVKVG